MKRCCRHSDRHLGHDQAHPKVGFWDDLDAQRRTVNEIDDYLYDDVKDGKRIALTIEDMDASTRSGHEQLPVTVW